MIWGLVIILYISFCIMMLASYNGDTTWALGVIEGYVGIIGDPPDLDSEEPPDD